MEAVVAACFCLSVLACLPAPADSSSAPPSPAENEALTMPGSPLGIVWSFLYGYQGVPAATYLPELRGLGAGFTKVYFPWNQLEPEKGRYDWSAVDAFVSQLHSPEEGLITLFSTSQWATRTPAVVLPPSPAKDPDDYRRFVYDLVKHCRDRVRYWQNEIEPNSPVFWSGTKEEFVAELKLFYQAVKAADPSAVVVAGGYDGLFSPPGMPPHPNQQAGLDFFDYVLKEGRDAFDVFDLHLYLDPYTIPGRVAYIRERMRALGYQRPIICTEYGGPNFFEFEANQQYLPLITSWLQAVAAGDTKGLPAKPIADLYAKMSTLPPQTQMFMLGCSPELEAKYQRIQSRGLVMRNLLAFSAGVQKALYFSLLDTHGARDDMMTLVYAKIGLLGERNGALTKRTPTADAYQRMAAALRGLRAVRRIDVPGRPDIFLFEVDRGARGPLHVLWQRRDAFSGEEAPAVPFEWPWTAKGAHAVDALGKAVPVQLRERRLRLPVSVTPIYIEPGR